MSTSTERMKQKHEDLTVKINELNECIYANEKFKTLSYLEQLRMINQLGFMESYAETLESRIRARVRVEWQGVEIMIHGYGDG